MKVHILTTGASDLGDGDVLVNLDDFKSAYMYSDDDKFVLRIHLSGGDTTHCIYNTRAEMISEMALLLQALGLVGDLAHTMNIGVRPE
jgi:hypothetical protein